MTFAETVLMLILVDSIDEVVDAIYEEGTPAMFSKDSRLQAALASLSNSCAILGLEIELQHSGEPDG